MFHLCDVSQVLFLWVLSLPLANCQPASPSFPLIAYQCLHTNVQPASQRLESPKGTPIRLIIRRCYYGSLEQSALITRAFNDGGHTHTDLVGIIFIWVFFFFFCLITSKIYKTDKSLALIHGAANNLLVQAQGAMKAKSKITTHLSGHTKIMRSNDVISTVAL